jgi:hypothetical protein
MAILLLQIVNGMSTGATSVFVPRTVGENLELEKHRILPYPLDFSSVSN